MYSYSMSDDLINIKSRYISLFLFICIFMVSGDSQCIENQHSNLVVLC